MGGLQIAIFSRRLNDITNRTEVNMILQLGL